MQALAILPITHDTQAALWIIYRGMRATNGATMEAMIAAVLVYFCTCMAADAEFQDHGVMAWSWQPDRAIMAGIWPVLAFAMLYDALLDGLFGD